jgi:hypothetical protein
VVARDPLRRSEGDDARGDGDVDLGVVDLARRVGEICCDLDGGPLGEDGCGEEGERENGNRANGHEWNLCRKL